MTKPSLRITPLGSVAKVISGFAFKSAEFNETGIPVIKIRNIQLGEIDLTETQCVPEHYLSIDLKYHVHCGDILISLTGSHINQPNSVVGRVARYQRGLPKALLNQRAGKVLIRKPDKCDTGFLYYHLYVEEIRREIAAFAHGAANQANVSPGQIESLCIHLPILPTQRKIAAILSAYDDLIENNLRRIKILEGMAQNLYREWFVKFRFPGHQHAPLTDSPLGRVPEGWELKGAMENKNWSFIHQSIGPYEGVRRYYATADIDGIAITGDGIEYTYSEKPSRAQKQPLLNSVWFARMQETYKVLAVAKPNATLTTNSMLSSGFAGFEAPDGDSFAFLFLTIKSKEFHSEKDRYCTGATQRSLTNDGLSRILTISPPREIVQHFGRVAMSFVELILALQQRNQTLRRTRDLLLPRLISGEVDVSKLAITVSREAIA